MWKWLRIWVISRVWKSLGEHVRKSLDCSEETIVRHMDVTLILQKHYLEMRNMLENVGKLILVIKWQRIWLKCAPVFCGK